jgi:hypothetical protein
MSDINVIVNDEIVNIDIVNEPVLVNVVNSPGVPGAPGQGVPVGGTTGQVLAKNSATNYDTEWVDVSGGAWGTITGTLSNQTDLQTALNGKFDDPTGTTSQYLRGDGSLATFPSLTGYVPYTGATGDVNLGTHRIIAQNATIASSGSSDTFTLNHSSGSGIGLNITKGGNGEGLYINKTGGSGNAATIIGTINATTLVKSGGTSSQFLKADGTVDSSVYVPTSRELTINGVTYDLSANRTYSVGTVTSVAALTIGTSGTDISSSVANGTTTPVITLNIPTASALNRGALSSTDWSTFNAKQGALTLTTTGTSGAATLIGTTLNIPQYSGGGGGGITGSGAAGQVAYWTGTSAQSGDSGLTWDSTNKRLSINTSGQARTISTYHPTGASGSNIWIGGGGTLSQFTTGQEGSNNTSVGVSALASNTTGAYNVAFGVNALNSNSTGQQNSAFGYNTLYSNNSGSFNMGFGINALRNTTTGSNNIGIGAGAGWNSGTNANTTGSNNIFIGASSIGVSATESNRTWIGTSSTTSTWLGGNLLLGSTTNSGERLQVTGTAKITSKLSMGAGTTSNAQINLASSTAPTSPSNGDIWFDGTDIKMRIGGVTKTFTLV